MALPIYATRDQGRVHIAAGEFYQGSVSSYNNWFTKIFANIFGMSVDVTINNKEYRVNKTDYVKILHTLGEGSATRKTINNYKQFNDGAYTYKNNGYMRNHLSSKKINKLAKKMIEQLVNGSGKKSFDVYLGKGAQIDTFFCNVGAESKIYFGKSPKECGAYRAEPVASVQERRYTPLLFAKEQNWGQITGLFLQYGARTDLQGMKRTFQRELIGAQCSNEVEFVPRQEVNYVPTAEFRVRRGPHGRGRRVDVIPGISPVVTTRQGMDTVQRMTQTFRDTTTNEQFFQYNPTTHVLDFSAIQIPNTDVWNNTVDIGRQQVI
jgi:hypothetical protein